MHSPLAVKSFCALTPCILRAAEWLSFSFRVAIEIKLTIQDRAAVYVIADPHPQPTLQSTSASTYRAHSLKRLPQKDDDPLQFVQSNYRSILSSGCSPPVKARFAQQPLGFDTASIRLVEVLPLGPGGQVKCTIRHATLYTPVYTCIAYVWGPPDEIHQTTIDHKPLYIRKNLRDFLEAAATLRINFLEDTALSDVHELDTERCFKSLWIDALCIDQENVMERNHQVQQMGQVYPNAEQAISWMGTNLDISSLFQFAWRHTRYMW